MQKHVRNWSKIIVCGLGLLTVGPGFARADSLVQDVIRSSEDLRVEPTEVEREALQRFRDIEQRRARQLQARRQTALQRQERDAEIIRDESSSSGHSIVRVEPDMDDKRNPRDSIKAQVSVAPAERFQALSMAHMRAEAERSRIYAEKLQAATSDEERSALKQSYAAEQQKFRRQLQEQLQQLRPARQ